MIPKFDPKELEVQSRVPSRFGGPDIPLYKFPASLREGMKAMYARKPLWQTTNIESKTFIPRAIPDNIARAFVMEAVKFPIEKVGGKDMFDLDWEYIPTVGGSIVRPGKPFLSDANEWYDKLKWPDVDSWCWEECYSDNKGYLKGDQFVQTWLFTGWFERLISFLDFEAAILALVDEEQVDAVKDLFEKLTDLYIKIADKLLEYYPQIDCFYIHDDWGSQRETFFSPDIVAEVLVPPIKRFNDYIHSKGRYCEFHSCGQAFKQVPNMIACGFDAWGGQPMNDTQKIYELYGDKILVGVLPDPLTPDMTEEQLRAAARAFAEKFCDPKKPCLMNSNLRVYPEAFREELYIASRKRYSGE